MTSYMPVHGDNVVARVHGWEEDGAARVEFLNEAPGFALGAMAVASVRPNPTGRRLIDFAHLRKLGLRTGGMVLLRKPLKEGDSTVTAKEIETLVPRRDSGIAVIKPGSAAYILPPPSPISAIVSECMVAFLADAVDASDALPARSDLFIRSLDTASVFGQYGALLTGEDRYGEVVEIFLSAAPDAEPASFVREFRTAVTPKIAAEIRRAHSPWKIVPFARLEVDPERASRISAQRHNFDYGDADSPMWTPTDAVLRSFAGTWLAVDVSSPESPPPPSRLLLELLETVTAA